MINPRQGRGVAPSQKRLISCFLGLLGTAPRRKAAAASSVCSRSSRMFAGSLPDLRRTSPPNQKPPYATRSASTPRRDAASQMRVNLCGNQANQDISSTRIIWNIRISGPISRMRGGATTNGPRIGGNDLDLSETGEFDDLLEALPTWRLISTRLDVFLRSLVTNGEAAKSLRAPSAVCVRKDGTRRTRISYRTQPKAHQSTRWS